MRPSGEIAGSRVAPPSLTCRAPEPSGFTTQTSLRVWKAIGPFAPGNEAELVPAAASATTAVAMRAATKRVMKQSPVRSCAVGAIRRSSARKPPWGSSLDVQGALTLSGYIGALGGSRHIPLLERTRELAAVESVLA